MALLFFSYKGLSWLYAQGNPKGLRPDIVDKLRKIFAFLAAIQSPNELRAVTVWKAHTLTGDRKGTWS
jgi:toxin HigB-1